MHLRKQLIAGAFVCLAALSGLAATAPAQDSFAVPTYSRSRMGADDWSARGGGFGRGYGGNGGYGNGFYQPYVSPVIASSWYARPYPYHFDYFRGRWDGGQGAYSGEARPAADCPCANEVAPTVAAPEQL